MPVPVRVALYVVIAACLILALRQTSSGSRSHATVDDGGASYRLDRASAVLAGVTILDDATRAATFSFASGTTPEQQQVFLAAIAIARPEARRLIDDVDGLVTVRFGVPDVAGAIGLTSFDGESYEVTVDLAGVSRRHGARGVDAVILHEMGHVVDRAVVPDELMATLDAQIPSGVRCLPGQPTGSCATVQERFADTFAKWAMDDLGVNGTVGYRILPPVPIAKWGQPLARLGAPTALRG
ncbi:MAG: hypothetical protein QOF69_1860 [Solirubrobacteraceae bacterium]|jgi:hypothetical protein|nr:hypothetical protein [Solirubrobacteraceae bacterium]